jgi:hypothetical protein
MPWEFRLGRPITIPTIIIATACTKNDFDPENDLLPTQKTNPVCKPATAAEMISFYGCTRGPRLYA